MIPFDFRLNNFKKLSKSLKKIDHYLNQIKGGKTFFLNPVIPQEIFDLILSFNSRKTLGPRNDKLLKFQDIIKREQMKIIFEFKSNSLPLDLNNLFQENKEINCHFTRNVTKEGLYIRP